MMAYEAFLVGAFLACWSWFAVVMMLLEVESHD